MYKLRSDQRGIAHVSLVVVVLVVAAVAGAGYMVYSKQKDSNTSDTNKELTAAVQEAAKNCKIDDKDICKFFASWKASEQYKVTSTDTRDGETTKSTFTIDGDKSHYSGSLGETKYEVITIGDATYTKGVKTWFKQTTAKDETVEELTESFDYDFEDPAATEAEESKTTYKQHGTEACGDRTCFKYEIVTEGSGDKQFLWFDDKDYQLRKYRTEGADFTSEQTFEYSGVSVSEPSPVKELKANQYVMPGSDEVQTLPSF